MEPHDRFKTLTAYAAKNIRDRKNFSDHSLQGKYVPELDRYFVGSPAHWNDSNKFRPLIMLFPASSLHYLVWEFINYDFVMDIELLLSAEFSDEDLEKMARLALAARKDSDD